MPDLAEARLYDSLADDQRDNAFGINDAGVVVGSFGARANPCAVIDPFEMTEPRAFVRLPKPGTQMGLSGSLPGLVAVDLHVAGGLPALLPPPPPGAPGPRSTANGVSESSRYVVGHAGYDLLQDGKAWLWDLRLGTPASVASDDLTNDIAGLLLPSVPPWNSEAHAVMHADGDEQILVAGGVDASCTEIENRWGFRLEIGDPLGATFLLPSIKPGILTPPQNWYSLDAIARDIGPAPAAYAPAEDMPVGYDWGGFLIDAHAPDPGPCPPSEPPIGLASCGKPDRASAAWLIPWDDDVELSQPDDGNRWDRVDTSSPAIDPPSTWPTNESAPGREAYSSNADGMWVGMMWRTDLLLERNDCFPRAYVAWTEFGTGSTPTVMAVDLEEASGYIAVNEFVESRAEAISLEKVASDRMLVAGEDIFEFPSRAVLWCGKEYGWSRHWLDELVRFDDVVELLGIAPKQFAYQLNDCSGLHRIRVVHDMNSHGQMVVSLRLGPEFSGTSSSVEFPCVVTLASDFNGDFRVDARDLTLLSGAVGGTQTTYDLNADGLIDSIDVAWLLGDFSGASPCDLHVILPCGGSGEGIGEGSGQAQDASSGGESVSGDEGGPSSTPMSVADAISALGFNTPGQFYSWIVEASEEQADAATYVLWTLVEGNS
jgi:hypothetical protein